MRYIETVNNIKKNFSKSKTTFLATCELFLSMLSTELDFDPKIKVVDLVKSTTLLKGALPCKHSML